MKAWGAWPWASAAWASVEWAIPSPSMVLLRGLRQRLVEVGRRHHVHLPPHAVVAEAAVLGAGNVEVSRLRGHEPDLDGHPRHGVLLHAEVGQEEAVDDVHRPHLHAHRPAHGQVELV